MKTNRTCLVAFTLLLAGTALTAQQQAPRSAAEVLEIERANQVGPIPAAPADERQLPSAEQQTAPAAMPATPVYLRTAADEKKAAQPSQSRSIPEPPLDEKMKPGQESLAPLSPAEQSTAVEKAKLPANLNEVEATQHRQNGVRRIPDPPKDEPKSNQ